MGLTIPPPIPVGAGLVNIDPPSTVESTKTFDYKVLQARTVDEQFELIGKGLRAHLNAYLQASGVGTAVNSAG